MSTNPTGNAEFNERQNLQFSEAAYWMGIMGRLTIFIGIVMCLGIVIGRIDMVIGGVISVVLGGYINNAAKSFKQVASTSGLDHFHVVSAVIELKKLFRMQVILLVITVVLQVGLVLLINVLGRSAQTTFDSVKAKMEAKAQ